MDAQKKHEKKLNAAYRKLRAAKWIEVKENNSIHFVSPDTSAVIYFGLRNQIEDNPYFPTVPARKAFKESKTIFGLNTLTNLRAFADTERGRYALNDFYIEWAGNAQRFVAADGRRLASIVGGTSETSMTQAEPAKPEITNVHADTVIKLYEVMAKLSGADSNVSFAVEYIDTVNDLKPALFMFGLDCVAVVHASEGQYPDYRAVLPKCKHAVKINETFFTAFEVVGRTTCDELQHVRTELTPKDSGTAITLRAVHQSHALRVASETTLNMMPKLDAFKEMALGIKPEYVEDAGILINGMRGQGIPLELHYTDNDTGFYIVDPQRKLDQILIMPVSMT